MQQARHGLGVERGTGGLERRRGHAGRRPEIELERRALPVADHVVHAGGAEDVGDLVRIGDSGDGAVHAGPARELRGRQHRALDVDVRIDEARQDQPRLAHGVVAPEPTDDAARPLDGAGINTAAVQVDDLAGEALQGWSHDAEHGAPPSRGNPPPNRKARHQNF